MNKYFTNIRYYTRQLTYRMPFNWYFVVFAVFSWLAFVWLRQQQRTPGTSFYDIFILLLSCAVFFIAALLAFSLLSVLIAFFYLQAQKRRHKLSCKIESTAQAGNKQIIHLTVHPVTKPVLGFIKFRVAYDENKYSEKFSIAQDRSKRFFSTTLSGTYHWRLPEIKEYKVDQLLIYVEDYFQFFSFVSFIKSPQRFYKTPVTEKQKLFTAAPRKTEDMSTRIEELKKVEGEYLNYKNFENNDDVRRIVWKIYAKNKELVVRIPEIMDPYASHIYLYPSFHSFSNVEGNDVVNIPFLNHYKTAVWNVYKQLQQQGLEVRYVPDQPIAQHAGTNDEQNVQYAVSTSVWQTDKDLPSFVRTNEAAVVVISSLTEYHEVERLHEQHGNDITFVFVQLSKSLRSQHPGDWLKWLFIMPDKNQQKKYSAGWQLSLLRNKLRRNEKRLKELLTKHQKPVVI